MDANAFDTTPRALEERVLRHRGCPLHYWVSKPDAASGERPPLVFLHGAFMDHRMFNPQVTAFADRHVVLALDTRGQSLSRPTGVRSVMADLADDVVSVMKEAGVERAVMVGQSMGAYVAQYVAHRHPARVVGLALIGCTPISFGVPRAEMVALRATGPLMGAWPREHFRQLTARSTARELIVQRYAYEQMCRHGRDDLMRVWAVVASGVNNAGVPFTPRVPVLLLHGEFDDRGTIHRDMPRWAAQNPGFRHELVPSAGHNANQDNPAHVNALLAEFLESLAQDTTDESGGSD